MMDKLIPIYFANSRIDKLTFYGLYEEWLAYKATVTNSSNTIKRHKQHYRKYFEPSVLHGRKVKKTGKTETYNTEELEELNRYLDKMYTETEDVAFLAVKINFLLGLRVGELVALKWEDCREFPHLHIVREEIKRQTNMR